MQSQDNPNFWSLGEETGFWSIFYENSVFRAGDSISFDQYNFYQDCYVVQGSGRTVTGRKNKKVLTSNAAFGEYVNLGSNTAVISNFWIEKSLQKLTNYDSTDNQWGYPCWNDVGVFKYLNRKDVQAALNIDAGWSQNMPNMTWHDCKQVQNTVIF